MKYLHKHNDTWYVVLRNSPQHNFLNGDGSVNLKVLMKWMEYIGGNHVLKQNDRFLIVKEIQNIEI